MRKAESNIDKIATIVTRWDATVEMDIDERGLNVGNEES